MKIPKKYEVSKEQRIWCMYWKVINNLKMSLLGTISIECKVCDKIVPDRYSANFQIT